MIEIRKAKDRGHANHGWLDSYHSFSFADYYDPAQMGFGALRVINEDRIQGGTGFGTHGHKDMEIISYVLEGELAHKDSMGNGSIIRPGDVQRMSAGTGVKHSEFNHSTDQQTHFLQIWIQPNVQGATPSYEEKHFEVAEKRGQLRLVASPNGEDGSLTIHQDAKMYISMLDGDEKISHLMDLSRRAYVHVARGSIEVNGIKLNTGDGLKAVAETCIDLANGKQAEIILFDLA